MDRSKWEYKKLGEVCAPKSDILRANKLFGNDDIIDYVDISSIDNTTHSITQPTSYVFKEAPSRAQQKVEQGDILYSLVRPNLKNIAVVTSSDTDKYVASSGFCVLRGKDVETRYLYHMVLGDAFTNYILGLVSGANYPAVREDDVKGFSFRCPPIADQQRIVAELDCLNEMIALKQEQLKEFDKLAQSIFYDMFGDPVSNEKGWIEEIMGNVCSFSQGVQVDLEKQTLNPKDGFERFIRISDFTTTDCELRYVKDVDRKYHIDIDDIAIVRYGASAGFVCWGLKGILANNLFKLNHDKAILNTRFLVQQLSTNYYRSFIKAEAFGAAMPALSFKSLKHFKLILPPLALQQQFAEKIQAIEVQKELVKKSIAETQQLLDSRMDYYFD
jgi:type I restriction enzyme S subunit